MLFVCGCAFVLFNLVVRHHLIHNVVGVVESQFVNCSSGFSEFKESLTEVVFKIVPCFVRMVGALPRLDVVFEDFLSIEDNEAGVYFSYSELILLQPLLHIQPVRRWH